MAKKKEKIELEYKFDHTTDDLMKGLGIDEDRYEDLASFGANLEIESKNTQTKFFEGVLKTKELDHVEKLVMMYMYGMKFGLKASKRPNVKVVNASDKDIPREVLEQLKDHIEGLDLDAEDMDEMLSDAGKSVEDKDKKDNKPSYFG